MGQIQVVEFITSLGDGGAETLVKEYIRLADRARFQFSVVVLWRAPASATSKAVEAMGISVFPIYPSSGFFVRVFNKLLGRVYVSRRLKKILKERDTDVLHVHLSMLKYVRPIRHWLRSVRLIYTCHSLPDVHLGKKRWGEKKAAEYLIRDNGLQMIALHDHMKCELNEMFGVENTLVIRNGVDFRRFRDVEIDKKTERNRLGIPGNAFVVGHVGRFDKPKNHPFLVEVFREVAARNENAFLLMVGAGDTTDIEKRLSVYGLNGRYTILSHRGDVNEILRAMDVFVFPSLYEGLPLVLVEAQASGLRCVVSDAIAVEAIRSEDVVALPLESPAQWAEVILDDSVKGVAHGDLEDYDMNKEIKRLEKLYAGEWDE